MSKTAKCYGKTFAVFNFSTLYTNILCLIWAKKQFKLWVEFGFIFIFKQRGFYLYMRKVIILKIYFAHNAQKTELCFVKNRENSKISKVFS